MQVDIPMGGCSGPDTDPSLVELPPPTAAPSMPSLPTISSMANCAASASHPVPPIIIETPLADNPIPTVELAMVLNQPTPVPTLMAHSTDPSSKVMNDEPSSQMVVVGLPPCNVPVGGDDHLNPHLVMVDHVPTQPLVLLVPSESEPAVIPHQHPTLAHGTKHG